MRVPDIYIIGAQKSGTTTLYDWLAQHPQIYSHPLAKDYPYFSDDCIHNDGARIFYSFSKDAPSNLMVLGGDANAMYASLGPQRMKQTMPNARLIAILRHPVQRAYSAYCHAVERLMEVRPLEQAIRDELQGIRYDPLDALRRDYLAHGQYAHQLKRIYKFFSSHQVKVVIFEEFKEEPLDVLRDVYRFIGVSDDFVPDLEIRNQTMGGFRSAMLTKIVHGRPSSSLVRKMGRSVIPFAARQYIRRGINKINHVERSKPVFSQCVKEIMMHFYEESIVELEVLLERRIALWRC